MDEHTLNDLLECSVCLERLDTSSKVLPCQHTFCRKCLEVIVTSRQELRCPECRVLVEVKIDDLPPNVLLMRILEGMKNSAAAIKTQQQQSKSNQDTNQANDTQQHQQAQMLSQHQQQHHNQQRQHHYIPNPISLHKQQQFQLNSASQNSYNIAQQFNHQQFLQQRRCLLPHAYALYDFESSEQTDLHFKKGDLVLLKRRVDSNWYVGQLNNGDGVISEGTFPINHVQVIVPLPTPQCIALYDFKMPPNEEQGCLTFKKGTIIHVLRRVDQNWAEGCIGSTIGIFPIAFVELNALAKKLLEAASIVANIPPASSILPPTMDTPAVNVSSCSSSSGSGAHQIVLSQLRNPPPMPINDSIQCDSTTSSSSPSNSSSNATSPHSVSTTTTTTPATNSAIIGDSGGVSSSSIPSSPNQSLPASPQHEATSANFGCGSSSVRFRDKREKRHSLNALLSSGTLGIGGATLSILQSNRHSAEILSIPSDTQTISENDRPSGNNGDGAIPGNNNVFSIPVPQNAAAREQQHLANGLQIPQKQQQQQQSLQSQQRVNVLKTTVVQQHMPTTLPWGYLALYPYKPRKSDELELKKGCVYIVTERCLDGWFKGKNWQDITGVFPGNYVTPLRNRDQQQLMHQWKYVPLQSGSPFPNQTNTTAANSNSCLSIQTSSALATTSQRIPNLHQPPDLPPRQVSGTLPISSVWTKPLGHTVEAFFNRYSKTHDIQKDYSDKEKDISRQKDIPKSASSNTAAIQNTSSTTSSAVQLMKRLAHIKTRSKSPNSATTRQQQRSPHSQLAQEKASTNDETANSNNCNKNTGNHSTQKNNSHFSSATTHGQLHPVHVRSGSCPSQLLQSLPHDQTVLTPGAAGSSTMAQIHENAHKIAQHSSQQKQQLQQQQSMQQISPHAVGYGSQQLRGPKERPHLQNARQSMDAANMRGAYNSTVTKQQLQQNPSNTKSGGEQQNQQMISSNSIIIANHRKSHSLDAAAVLSNSNNDSGATCGKNGGVTALIAPSNITAAAVAASATTKSTQSSRESRFRCVVPYPPNSDIELELQVGDIIYVQRRQKNGWYKGTHAGTNKTGLFPASFVEPDI